MMPVTHILVEGKDDLVFIRRLIDIMRADLPVLEWKLLPPGRDTITIGSGKFGNCFTTVGGAVIALSEVKGFARDPSPFSRYVKADHDYQVNQLVVLFDADLPQVSDFGGFRQRLEYLVNNRFSKISIGKKFFLFPDNKTDGTLENLAIAMIRPTIDFVIHKNWREYRDGLKSQLTKLSEPYLDDTVKCGLSQFCTVFDAETAKDLYWIAALWNENIWDWNAVALNPLKQFLQTNIPQLFLA